MDIGSFEGYPCTELSNFHPHLFIFDSVECASMEGLLQAFKYEDEVKQVEVCALSGKAAKFKGKKRNKAWKSRQTLWWRGVGYPRESLEYQQLLDRAFEALANNQQFRAALLASGGETFTHSFGSNDPTNTVLTVDEFCSRLLKLREKLNH